MTSKFSSFTRLVMFSIVVLGMASAAHSAPNCSGGSLFRVGGVWQGCIFPGPTWDSFQHSMCQGAVEIPSSADATCHMCVNAPYEQDVLNGNWQNMTPSDLTCARCVASPPGLLGWVDMDESYLVDIPSYDWDIWGDIYGNPVKIDGHVLRALQFDGTDDYIQVADGDPETGNTNWIDFGAAGSPMGSFSFAAWVKPTPPSSTYVGTLLDKRTYSATFPNYVGYSFYLYGRRPGVQLADASGYGNFIATPSVPADGLWHFVAIVVERTLTTREARFYIDGAPAGLPINVNSRSGSLANNGVLRVGMRSFSVPNGYKGGLDEPMLFGHALTVSEVQSLYTAGVFGICRPLA